MGLTIRHRLEQWQLLKPTSWLVLGAGAVWTYVFVGAVVGTVTMSATTFLLLSLVPLVVGIVLLLTRNHWPYLGLVTGWIATISAAVYTDAAIVPVTLIALGIPALLLAVVLARRYPATFLVVSMAITGFFGSAEAFLSLKIAPGADVLLAGLWLGTIWSYLVDHERPQAAPFLGLVLVFLYVLLSFFEIFSSNQGLVSASQDFRGSTWYMMSALLLVFAPIDRRTIKRAALGFVAVAIAVGGYATLRWIIGQSGHELQNAFAQTNNNVVGNRIRLIGSFVAGKELAAWTATAIPFCLAWALSFSGRRRMFGLIAVALCAVAMFGADVRVALVGVVPAVIVVFVLYQICQAFPGAHIGTTLTVLFAAAVIGVGAFAFTLAGNSDTGQRYRILITAPTQDPSYRARVFKWNNALADIGHHPLGQGLGTAGRTQARYGRFVNISNSEIDSSYLKIAVEQGAAVALFYFVALVLLGWGLLRRALRAPDPFDAALAIGAVGVLIVFAILLFAGTYIEGLTALTAWLLVGIGAAGVTRRAPQPATVGQSTHTSGPDPVPPSGMPSGSDGDRRALVETARALSTDVVAREVWAVLEEAGVESILLKGATLAEWLYDDREVRTYSDVDLLVESHDVGRAEKILGRLGFRTGDSTLPPETPHARPWHRPTDGAIVDLHWTVAGACVAPEEAWDVLRAHAVPATVGGGRVLVLDRPATSLMVALHASQHEVGKPLEDLQRALDRVPLETWREACVIADRLDAGYGISRGVRMLPAGEELADQLGLPTTEVLSAVAANPGSLVLGFERLSQTPGVGAKAKLISRELVPAPEFLRWRFPLARRGRGGLALTYLGRPAWLAWRAFPSARAWRRARGTPPGPRNPEEGGASEQ